MDAMTHKLILDLVRARRKLEKDSAPSSPAISDLRAAVRELIFSSEPRYQVEAKDAPDVISALASSALLGNETALCKRVLARLTLVTEPLCNATGDA